MSALQAAGLITHRLPADAVPPALLALSRLIGTRRTISREPSVTKEASSPYSARDAHGASAVLLRACKEWDSRMIAPSPVCALVRIRPKAAGTFFSAVMT